MRVKEINWFDGVPVVTIRDGLLGAECLNYHQIQIGQYIKASITRVNAVDGNAVLKVNEFV